uniref:peptidylprolyl isomerase n=1 Tax=Oryzias latipes TaxID=8090 RepID=A0A3B3ILX5_ORYLA
MSEKCVAPNPTVLDLWAVLATADELLKEVKTEVVSKPEQCTQKSKKGDLINAHYDGYLLDGSQFYCSRTDKAGHPQWFVLGVGQVIKGLDIGMMDMCAGEKRKITVPSDLAFGKNGKGPVPPNATVVFEVEVLSVSRGPRSMEAFTLIDLDQDRSLTKAEVTTTQSEVIQIGKKGLEREANKRVKKCFLKYK